LAQNADTIVLGCTHYPFLAPLIREVAGPAIDIIDSSAAVARELRRRLSSNDLLSIETDIGTEQFWTSATTDSSQPIVAQLWERNVEVFRLPAEATT
jgi:glutamate racemase